MYFLVSIVKKADGTFTQGTAQYETMEQARIQFHIAMASAMQKDYLKATCTILNENGLVQKNEVYEVATTEESTEA